MITTTLSAFNLCKSQVIALGRQLENNYRQIVFDCSDFSEEITAITLVHQRKDDIAPYIVATSTGDTLTWTITDTDTAYYGYGKGELRITFDSGLAKSIVFTTMVVKSITADTVIPSALQSWYDAMIDYIDEHSISPEELGQAIEDYLEEHPITVPVTSVNGETGAVVITAADLGALTVELDPVFGASAAAGITSTDITAWNGKYTKPSSGIPATDLTSTVQSRLLKTGGTTGQVLAKKTNSNYDVEWVNQSGGGGAVDSVNGKTGTVVLDASDVGALPSSTAIPTKTSQLQNDSGFITSAPVSSVNGQTGDVTITASGLGAYVKPTNGIPKTDLDSAVQTSLGKADTALQTAPVTSVNGATGAVVIPTATTSANGLMSSADKTLLDSVTERIASTLPVNTVTGAIVSVTDGADNVPVKDLTIDIDYKESGWTGANVTRCGKNLFGGAIMNLAFVIQTDTYITEYSQYRGFYARVGGGETYTISRQVIESNRFRVAATVNLPTSGEPCTVLANDASQDSAYSVTVTVPSGYNYLFVYLSNQSDNCTASNYQIEAGSTATAYEPYTSTIYPISWQSTAGTVYGGSLDVTTGVLTSTLASDGTELATPVTYQLTPTEVSTLLGANNVWTDTGDTTLTYRASLQPVYDDYSSALVALNGE